MVYRGEMLLLKCTVLVAVVAGIALAGPINWEATGTECATTCPHGTKFGWESSKVYEYAYTGDMKTLIEGATEEHSSLHIQADVHIQVLSRCELNMKLENVILEDSNPSDYEDRSAIPMQGHFKSSLEANTLRFAWKDGVIEAVCPNAAEEIWVLNIKRGIASQLQNTMADLGRTTTVIETDISGSCPVSYKPLKDGKIQKSKDILACVGGQGYESVFTGVPYESASRIQSLPILKSSHVCEQTVDDDRIITQVTCLESHKLRPFSRGDSGAVTIVTTSLVYTRTTDGHDSEGPIASRASLAFDATPQGMDMGVQVQVATEAMQDMCEAMAGGDVRPEVPVAFAKLVKAMKGLDSHSLRSLYTQSKGGLCDKAMKYFSDVIPLIHSAAALPLIRDLIRDDEITQYEADIWLTSLAMIPRPSLNLLTEAIPLISLSGHATRKAALAVSSLVHSYCLSDEHCAEQTPVTDILAAFEARLNYNCRGEHEDVLMALKAIGNAGQGQTVAGTLANCFTNSELPMEIRVAAVNAYRRTTCEADRSELLNVYLDNSVDSELRINAYLQVIRCASSEVIDRVASQLENEEINQVGSFVWTHLTNLMESSNPHKLEISKILENKDLKKEFNLDARKFSRNVEWSGFSHLLNSGASLESNIIMSEKSFIPRTVSSNITIDVFGRSINLLEIEGRAEGLDSLLEKLFGPKPDVNDIAGRSKRDAIDAFDSDYNVRSDQGPQASYSMKVLGNEIRYGDFHSLDIDSMKENMNFLNWLITMAQNQEYEINNNLMFMDWTLLMPTATGMPMKVNVEGTASVQVKVSGKLDIRRLMTWPSNVDIDGSIQPSGAVQMVATMGVDGHCAKTGLQMIDNLHSSSVLQGKLLLKEGKIFSFNLDMPKDTVEVVKYSTKFLITHRDELREQQMLTDNVFTYDDCIDLNKPLGIEVCSEASVPLSQSATAPRVPLTGPIRASLVINKKDTHTGYTLDAQFIQEKTGGVISSDLVMFAVNTPGGQIDREISTQLKIDRVGKAVSYKLKSPWKTVDFDANYVNSAEMKSFSTVAVIDGDKRYSFTAELPISKQKNGNEYTPSVQLDIHGMEPMKVTSRFFNNPGRKLEYEVRLRNIFKETAKVNGEVIMINNNRKMHYELSNEIESSFFTSSLSTTMDYSRGKAMSNRIQLEYAFADGKKESFVINNKLKDESTNALTQYDMDSQWTNTLYPAYNGDLDLDFTYGRKNLIVNLDAGFDKNNRVKVTQSGNFNFDGDEKKADGLFKLELPGGKEYEVTLKHSHSYTQVTSKANLKYGNNKQANLDLMLKRESTSPLKMSADVKVTYPGREITIMESLEETDRFQYDHKLEVSWAPDKKIESSSHLKLKPRLEMTTDLQIPSLKPLRLYAHYKPTLRDLQTKAEFTYGQSAYGIEGNWNHGGNRNAFTSRGNFEVKYPSKRMTLSGDLSRRDAVITGNIVTQWDADNDLSKQISVVVRTTMTMENPAFYLKADYHPQQFFEVSASHRYQVGDWMKTPEDVQADLSFKSSYDGLEHIAIAVKYDSSPNQVDASAEVGFTVDQKITADLNLNRNQDFSDARMTLTVKTPFNSYRNNVLEAFYTLEGRNVKSAITASWDDQQMALTGDGEFNIRRHMLESTVKFTSPFTRPVVVTAKHNDNGKVFNTNLGVTWSGNQEMKYDQVLTYDALKKLAADIKFTSPFNGMEEISLNSKTELLAKTSELATSHVLKWAPGRQLSLDMSVKAQLTWQAGLRLTTPWREFDRLFISTNNRYDGKVWMTHVDLEYTGAEKIILQTTVGLDSVKTVGFFFNCPPGDLGTTEFNAVFTGGMRKFTTGVDFKNDRIMEDKISLTGELDSLDLRDCKASLNYNSPVGLSFFSLNLGNTKSGRTYTTDASLEYPQYKGTFNNVVTITDITNFDAQTQLEYKPGAKIEVSVGLKSRPDYEGKLSVITPFYDPITFSVFHAGDMTDFRSSVNLNYASDKAIESVLTFTMQSSNQLQGLFTLNMPVTGWNEISLQVKHDATGRKIESSAEFGWNPESKIAGSFELMTGRGSYSSSIRITTPFSVGSRINLVFTHQGQITDFTNSIVFEFDTKKYEIDNSFKMGADSSTATTEIKTPIPGYEVMSGKYLHSGSVSEFTCDAEFTSGGKTRTFDLTVKTDPQIEITFEIDGLSWDHLNNIKGGFNHQSKHWKNFNTDGFVEFDGKRYTSSMDFKWYGKTFRLSTSAENPKQNYGLSINHKGGLNDFTSKLVIDIGRKDIKAEASFKNGKSEKTGKLELVTPFSGYKATSLEFNYAGQLKDFIATLNVITPSKHLPEIKFTLTHAGSLKDFTSILAAEYNGKSAETVMKFKIVNRANFEGSIETTTPYEEYEKFTSSFKYEATKGGNKVASFSLETPIEKFRKNGMEISSTGTLRTGVTNVIRVDTSVPGYENWLAEAKYTPTGTGHQVSAKVETPIPGYTLFSASGNYNGKLENLSVGILVETSVQKFNRFGTDFSLAISDSAFSSEFKVDMPFRKFRSQSIGVSASYPSVPGRMNGKVFLETSYPGYEVWSVEFTNAVENSETFGSATKLDIQTPVQGYTSFVTELNLEYSDVNTFKISLLASTSVPGYETFETTLENLSRENGFKITGAVETSVKGWSRFGSELEHTSKGENAFKTSFSVDTPFKHFERFKIILDHNGKPRGFDTTVTIYTPLSKANEVAFNVKHEGVLKDFTTALIIDYAPGKKVETEVTFKKQGSVYDGSIKMSSPCPVIQSIEILAAHDRTGSGNLDITYNSQKFMDLDYMYTKKAPFSLHIKMDNPRPYEITLNFDQTGKSCTGDLDINFEGQQFKLESNLKNSVEDYNIEREFSVATSLPSGLYRRFYTVYKATPSRRTHNTELQWARAEDMKAVVEMELSNSRQRGQKIVDGNMKITSPWLNSHSTINHVMSGGRKYDTEIVIESGQRIVLRNALDMGNPTFTNKFTMQHPNLRQDMEVEVEGTVSLDLVEGRFRAKLEQEELSFHAKMANEQTRKVVSAELNHPTSDLDMSFLTEIFNDNEKVGTGSTFSWKTTDGQDKVYKMIAEINKIRKELNAEMSCPGRSMTMTGQKSVSDEAQGIHKWNIVGSCGQGSIQAELSLSRPDKTAEGHIALDGDRVGFSLIRENLQDKRLEVYHETRGRRVQDILLSVNRAEDDTLTQRTYFRPDMVLDLKNYLQAMNVESDGNCWTDAIDMVGEDLQRKADIINTRTLPVLTGAAHAVAGDQIELISTTYERMYRNNDYKVRTIANKLAKFTDWSEGKLNRMFARATEKMKLGQRKLGVKFEYWSKKVNGWVNVFGVKFAKFREEYIPMFQDINEVIEATAIKIQKVVSYIKNHPVTEKLRQAVRKVESMDLLAPIDNLRARIVERVQEFKQQYAEYVDVVGDVWSNVEKRTEVKRANKWVKRVHDWVAGVYEHYEIENRMKKKAMKTFRGITLEAIKNQMYYEVKNHFQTDRNQVKIWDPENGNYEVEFYIPADPFKDLVLPKLYLKETLYKAMDWVKENWPESDINLYDVLYTYKPSRDPADWVPPFKGHAAIAGNQHYMTFDKKFYEFYGDCSYMLARDFIDGKFTVLVNYDTANGDVSKSITVHDGDKSIQINNGKVTVDGASVEMPMMMDHTLIRRMGSEIRIDNAHGATVTCALHYDRCTLNVTGWYYGKTGGLLGTYDNEPGTDFTTSTNKRTSNINTFTNSWAVGRRCRTSNMAREMAAVEGTPRYDLCAKYFVEPKSAFRSCYGQVTSAAFMQMCMNDMGSNGVETEQDVCKAAAFYVDECERHGVPLRMPSACVSCVDPKGEEFLEGNRIKLEGDDVPQTADVVFVVQHSACNQEVIPKLGEIAKNFDEALISAGLSDNKFGVVGYGGMGDMKYAHSHTLGGEIMSDARTLVQSASHMESMPPGTDKADALSALKYAAKYSFRTGASKTVILIPCDACKEGKVRYHEMQQLLVDRDIHLHVILDHKYTLRSSGQNKKTAYMFGADKEGLFTKKHLKGDLTSDKELYNQVRLPKDICAALAFENDGTSFSVHQLLDSRRDTQKKFTEVMVRVHADLAAPSECQYCECKPGEDGVGMSVCESCDKRSIYRFYPDFFSMGGFGMPEIEGPPVDKHFEEQMNRDNRGPPSERNRGPPQDRNRRPNRRT